MSGADLPFFHLALAGEWEEARARGGPYTRSTRGLSLEEVGFIHCSFAPQAQGVADAFYAGRSDVVLLRVDPSRLSSPVKVEVPAGGQDAFPHIYGPLNLDAVVVSTPVIPGPDGRLQLDDALAR